MFAAVLAAGLAANCPAWGQLSTINDRAYFGVNRPIPIQVKVPKAEALPAPAAPTEAPKKGDAPAAATESAKSTGEVRIDLFEVGREGAVATAPVLADLPVDLAGLFPVLWQGPMPRLRYAQLVVAGKEVGPPLVLQPMISEARAKLVDPKSRRLWFRDPATNEDNFRPREGVMEWVTEPPAYAGLRIYADQHVILETSLGEMEFRLRPDAAPNSVWNFRELVRLGFYNEIIFHRIVPALASGHPFVVQVGDPTGTGDGGPGFSIDLEPSNLPHDFGVLSLARSDDPDTNGSQIFIALSREGTARLDGLYTAFGEMVRGTETLVALSKVSVKDQRPTDPPILKSARLVDAPPWSSRPPRVTRPVEKSGR
jgi:peptidyl-prolyl cis-trans isomerase B (cyclophilin B)